MPTQIEAIVDERGHVRLLHDLRLPTPRRAIVTVLDEAVPASPIDEDTTSTGPIAWTQKYEPIRTIGRGGMSVVHLARDRVTGALVCVKALQDQVRRSALQQECRALARLKHPGILRLLNFETRGNSPYMVTEFGAGVPLTYYLRSQVTLQQPIALALAFRMFDAVAAAHDEQVIHRDLKPDNVLVDKLAGTLWPKLLDFGLAVVDQYDDRDARTAAGMPAGTFLYMAPEQIAGRELTPACDVYALGQICWEMIMGVRAFPGAAPQVFAAKMSRDGLELAEPPLGVDVRFADLIRRCTRIDPSQRPPARDVSEALLLLPPAQPQQASWIPTNLTLRETVNERPLGWFDGLGSVHGTSMWYSCRVFEEAASRTPTVCLEREGSDPSEFGVLMQRVPAAHLAGSRVRLTANVRTERVSRRAGLWIRADDDRQTLVLENMHQRPIQGSTDWTAASVEIEMPATTTWLNYGVLLAGDGELHLRDVRLIARTKSGAWIELGLPTYVDATPFDETEPLT